MSNISNKNKSLAFVILVGGKSTRFGEDKGIFEFLGKPLISYQIEVLSQFNHDIFIVAYSQIQIQEYIERIKSLSLSPEIIARQKDLKIVYTPIHGTGVKLVPDSLKAFGFENIYNVPEQDVVDGNFPTVKSPNPEESAALNMAIQKAKEVDANLGMLLKKTLPLFKYSNEIKQGSFDLNALEEAIERFDASSNKDDD